MWDPPSLSFSCEVPLLRAIAWPCPDDCSLCTYGLSQSLGPSRPPGPNLQVRCHHTRFRCPTITSAPPTTVLAPCRTNFYSTDCKLFSLHRSKIDSLTGARSCRGMITEKI
ncbi:hypothetical protein BHM03_00040935 [Ensete ventricosum]|nr:hypothetical protein BHM03_00040935 [Ensete ventricosum]